MKLLLLSSLFLQLVVLAYWASTEMMAEINHARFLNHAALPEIRCTENPHK